jgi:hypothetical protein
MRSCAIRAIFKLSGASPSSDSETIFVASNGRITPKPADFHSHPLWDRRARKFLMTKWDRPRIRRLPFQLHALVSNMLCGNCPAAYTAKKYERTIKAVIMRCAMDHGK